jgi:DNA-binding response OmpR family regulator
VNPARILVVDNDPWIQRTAATVLGRRGYLITMAGDAQGALASAMRVPPDLVISSVMLPALDGWCWWEKLRAKPEFATTPLLFLVPSHAHPGGGHEPAAAEGVRGLDPGRDERLPKPFRNEDLERVVHVLLGRAATHNGGGHAVPRVPWVTRNAATERASSGYRPLSALRGGLDEIALSSILVVLEMERKTGILLLEREGGTARLYLRKGRIIRADTDPPGALSGAAAVYEALSWSRGSFDLLVGDVGGIDEIQTSTTYLLMEGARRLDEAKQDGGKPPAQ